jgi:hypothetical protein
MPILVRCHIASQGIIPFTVALSLGAKTGFFKCLFVIPGIYAHSRPDFIGVNYGGNPTGSIINDGFFMVDLPVPGMTGGNFEFSIWNLFSI